MASIERCPYRDVNFAKEQLCILDPDHFAMKAEDFKSLVISSIKQHPEKKDYWTTYHKVIKIIGERCPYLDGGGIKDTNKRVSWIPDDFSKFEELIPDSSLEPKCRCLYPNKYKK